MKTFWKWIIGIVIALAVIAAAMFGVRYLVSTGVITLPARVTAWHNNPAMGRNFKGPQGFDGQPGFNGWGDRRGPGFNGMGNRERGFDGGRGRGFGPLMFIGGLFRLVFFGALLYGAYWLGKRNARVVYDPAPVAPVIAPVDEAPKRKPRKVA